MGIGIGIILMILWNSRIIRSTTTTTSSSKESWRRKGE
uniref:Uncharacterized protein n=1 Tax=Rhizophora mucronata TaxID=61149 RepID=A0A2P2Q929_RHIMU